MASEDLYISISDKESTRVVNLKGDLDSYNSERLTKVADTWIGDTEDILINLDGLRYIDSSGLSSIVGIWQKSIQNGVRIRVSCKNEQIKRVLDITGLYNLFVMDSAGKDAYSIAITGSQNMSFIPDDANQQVQSLNAA